MNMNIIPALNSQLMLKLVELKKKSIIKNIIEEENKFDPKYKTELCKKFQSTGYCPYGFKCRFAHGKDELITKSQGVNYKKKQCKTFHEKGYCPYGSRCNFRHDERKFSEISFSYYYFQLFLFKKYNINPSKIYLCSKGSKLLNGRLPIFESFSKISNNDSNQFQHSGDLLAMNEIERTNSSSTISSSNEEERKISPNNKIFHKLRSNDNQNKVKNLSKLTQDISKSQLNLTKNINL